MTGVQTCALPIYTATTEIYTAVNTLSLHDVLPISPPLVLWAIAEEIRAIGRVLDGMAAGRTPPQLWRDAKVWGSTHQSLMQRNGRRFTKEQVEAALMHAARTDRMVKGLIRGDVWDELLQLALRFAVGAPAKSLPKQGKMAAAARAAERQQPGLF